MLRYEIKKVFSKSKNRMAVIVLFVILVITSILTINRVEYVDENGNASVGISAARDLRAAKNQWAGYLTTDTLRQALEENRTINSSKEALSDDITEQNKAYAKKQGIAGIMDDIFFSARFGRSRGISAKVGAGFCVITGFYLMFVFLYTFIVLFVLGADGASCPIQLDLWRSVYNMTFLQAYLFIVLGGYIGTLFAATLAMIVSAFTHSTQRPLWYHSLFYVHFHF